MIRVAVDAQIIGKNRLVDNAIFHQFLALAFDEVSEEMRSAG